MSNWAISFLLLLVYFGDTGPVAAANSQTSNRFILPSCDVSITADKTLPHKQGVTYIGNVKVLVGFANLRLDKATLIKNKDGRCELVTESDE